MIIELSDNALRAFQRDVNRDGVYAVQFKTRPDGVEIKINEDGWSPTVGAIRPDPTEMLATINGHPVFASFFDRDNNRFGILTRISHPTKTEYVVAYVRTLQDREWFNGRYTQDHDKAVRIFSERMAASMRP